MPYSYYGIDELPDCVDDKCTDNIRKLNKPEIELIVDVRVEIRKGSVIKYEWNNDYGALCVDRMLHGSEHYIFNYGEILNTLGGDCDALDAVILTEHKLEPSCIVRCRPVGVLHTIDEKGEDDKIIVVPVMDPDMRSVTDINDVSEGILDKIKSFFQNYKNLETGKFVNIKNFENKHTAMRVIRKGINQYMKKKD